MLEAMTEDHQCSVLAVAAMTADTFTQSSPPAPARLGWYLRSRPACPALPALHPQPHTRVQLGSGTLCSK